MKYFISGNGMAFEVTDDFVVIYAPDNATPADALDDPADNPRFSVADLKELL